MEQSAEFPLDVSVFTRMIVCERHLSFSTHSKQLMLLVQ